MATNSSAKVEIEAGVTPHSMHKLSDSGDHKQFDTNATLISLEGANAPIVLPNGFINGGDVSVGVSGTNDKVDVSASKANLNGVANVAVASSIDLTIVRAATDVASITSITCNAGGTIAVVKGTDSADTTFSETRAAAGGPPLIPIDSIELAQVRTTSNTAAPITAAEIFNVVGTHRESPFFPVYEIDHDNATINFSEALPLIHTGAVVKAVHASYADPIFIEQINCDAFVPAKKTSSVGSTQKYNGVLPTETRGFAGSSFTTTMKNGIDTDPITLAEDKVVFVRFTQDRDLTPYSLTQGRLNYTVANASADHPQASVTIAALRASVELSS